MIMIRILLFFVVLTACQPAGNRESTTPDGAKKVEKDPTKIYNLMGEELPPKPLTEEKRQELESKLKEAKAIYDAHPDSLEAIIWYGRRLAYLGRYLEAIEVYSDGLKKFPNAYRLYRHRGHRYITIRKFDEAINDFEMAVYYSLNAENAVEQDGIPNKLNKPLSNDKFNIWYHYGLALYLNGRYDKAISAYKKCMEYSDNNDLKVATSYWTYLSYMKVGNKELANAVLEPINGSMKVIENNAYLDLLLLFKGAKKVEDLEDQAFSSSGKTDPTLGYGIGQWYQQQGNIEKANEIFLKVLDSPDWDAFGYIACEAELTAAFPVPVS